MSTFHFFRNLKFSKNVCNFNFYSKFRKMLRIKKMCSYSKKCLDFFCHANNCSKFKKYSHFSKKMFLFKKKQDLKRSFDKCSKFEKYFVLAICAKIENNVCIKETHFLKFFCMFNTSSHLKKLFTT